MSTEPRRLIPYAGWEPAESRRPRAATSNRRRVDRDAVLALHKEGLTNLEIAGRLGHCRQTVCTTLKAMGVPDQRRRCDPAEIIDLLQQGMRRREVARRIGVSEWTVREIGKGGGAPQVSR